MSELPKKAVKLDNATDEACLKAFDFILDEKSQAYFLEINPTGDWYWIEHDTRCLLLTQYYVIYLTAVARAILIAAAARHKLVC